FTASLILVLYDVYVLVRMVSAAGTGYCVNIKKARLQEKLVLLKYDPIGKNLRN
uniref:Large ribosomal subunit protein bL33m n=1 Tax=Terrapene triunguis TaxID=2587831 RepID=A0A674IRM2_9SAUR